MRIKNWRKACSDFKIQYTSDVIELWQPDSNGDLLGDLCDQHVSEFDFIYIIKIAFVLFSLRKPQLWDSWLFFGIRRQLEVDEFQFEPILKWLYA